MRYKKRYSAGTKRSAPRRGRRGSARTRRPRRLSRSPGKVGYRL